MNTPRDPTAPSSLHRSGAVARMLRMPVATLRVWERRYGLTQAALSPSGQRLYSADDVRRLALLKQLTDLGHAIGRLASLDMAELQRVAATHAQALATTRQPRRTEAATAKPPQAWRLAVVGSVLGQRLQHPALLRRLGRPLELLGPFDDVTQAAAALQGRAVDAVLLHQATLHGDWLRELDAAAPAWAQTPKAVLYGFAAESLCESLAEAGVSLLREPQPDVVLAQWISGVSMTTASATTRAPGTQPAESGTAGTIAPRRWDDAALADFAGLSFTVACECPRQVAELLTQLSRFEAYSAQCENRSPADATLHAYLRQVAAEARASFETALEQVALHEGLLLPVSKG